MSRRAEVLLEKLTGKLTLSDLINAFSLEKTARGERVPESLLESAEVIFGNTDRIIPFFEYPYDNLLASLSMEERQRLVAESPYSNPVLDREKFAEILIEHLSLHDEVLLEPSKAYCHGIWSYAHALEEYLVELTAEGEQMRAWKHLADENPFLAAALRLGDDAERMRSEGLKMIISAGFFAEYLGKALTPVKVGEEEKFFLNKGTRVNGKVEDKKFILEGIVGDRTVRVSRPLTDDLLETAAEVVQEFKEKVALIPEGKELEERAEKALETLPEAEGFIEKDSNFSPGL